MIIRELCDVSVKRLGGLQTGLLLSIDKKTYGLERTDAMWLKTAVRPSCFLCFVFPPYSYMGFPGGTVGKESAASAGYVRYVAPIHGSGRSPGRGNSNPLRYSYLENLMDRRAWQASVQGGHKRVGHN